MERTDPAPLDGRLFSLAGTHILATAHGGVYRLDEELRAPVERLLEGGDLCALPSPARRAVEEVVALEARAQRAETPAGSSGRFLRALCLNVAHACNMQCAYCFAGRGTFGGGEPSLMPLHVAERAIDFLLERSAPDALLQVDYFGGEPLLNMGVVRAATEYATKRLRGDARRVQFTLTTNGVLLDEEITAWLNEKGFSVILSLDGPEEIHDSMRRLAGGAPSYALVSKRIRDFLASREGKNSYVRGTYTRQSLHFSRAFEHLRELGVRAISLEPVIAKPSEPFALREADAELLEREYERLAARLLEETEPVTFFHFNLSLDKPLCKARRMKNCGAAIEYLAVTPAGDLYPCHQFIGREGFRLGGLDGKGLDEELRDRFRRGTILQKEPCARCWARFYCSGGCFANSHLLTGDPLRPVPLECRLMKKRIECALWLEVRRREKVAGGRRGNNAVGVE